MSPERRPGNASRERALGPRLPLLSGSEGEHRGLGMSQQTLRGWQLHPATPATTALPTLGGSARLGVAARCGFLGWRDDVCIVQLPLLPACLQGWLELPSPEACGARGSPHCSGASSCKHLGVFEAKGGQSYWEMCR